jgi:serine phosphatase RsbU (regulator of sigma subunit)
MDNMNIVSPSIETVDFSGQLAKTVLNAISANIAILDENGVILETNQAWRNYATTGAMEGPVDSVGVNYLEICDATTGKEAKDASEVAAGIRSVIRGETKEFLYDYPCHGPDGPHFYFIRVVRVANSDPLRIVVSHEDITALKLAEESLRKREQERDRLRHSLELAREVQQRLLPHEIPTVAGLDVAGRSIYCDETGGDYYDFIPLHQDGTEKLAVIVGDVSGHGISSALTMAAVRSALRQRLLLPGDISQIIADVNRQMAGDVKDSGQFITLFFLSLDPIKRLVKWVRAGHDAAIFYNHTTGQFDELNGEGMALGVDPHAQYEENVMGHFNPGSIIVLGTDGIWESRDSSGEMLGKRVLNDIIRQNASHSAAEIMEAIITNIKKFQGGIMSEDDLTLVVVKTT